MFVLGIDPGLSRCGYGVVRQYGSDLTAMAGGVVTTEPDLPLQERLRVLFAELRALVAESRPDAVVVERVFFQTNARTAMATGQAGGVALLVAAEAGCEVAQYSANEVKQAVVGYGGATKDQVQRMVAALLGLAEPPKPARRRRRPGPGGVPPHRPAAAARRRGGRIGDRRPVIGWLRGELVARSPEGEVIVDVGGVGYRVTVSPTAAGRGGRSGLAGGAARPHPRARGRHRALRLRHRRGATVLRGAARRPRGRPGPGPRRPERPAPADLVRAVLDEDLGALCTVPGVGRKTAARLVLDLRSRLELPAVRRRRGARRPARARPRPAARSGPRWPSSATAPTRSAGRSRAARTRARSRSCCARRCGSWRGHGERPARGAVDSPPTSRCRGGSSAASRRRAGAAR